MADFKYIMQGFQKDINFFDEIKEVLETEDYTSIWILTAFVNERAICNLMPSIKKSKADISFIIGIRNNVSTYQALKCLINMKVSVFVFDTARIESIFHAKVIVGSGTNSAKVICGSANITTGGLANNIDDADELLCQALAENDIKAVAITDHFKIDKTRIEHLRKLAPEIVFFPGVELRTDKGANNLHLILIFSELSDLETLSADFNAIMLRTLAKSKESDETIYWQFDDIVEFCKNHGGLISIHAGKKSNGIDKEISNALPVKEAIKSDIAKHVDFFEVGKKKDIVDYYKYVFKEIDEKPIILCSDCHDPRKYSAKESLWIKANVTFEGLKQCIFQPSERVYVGTIPAAVDRVNKNKKANIDSLSVHRIIEPKNDGVSWFDFDISLNAGLVAVIGNKGSGKSAFSDIIGQVCKCRTMGSASFLNDNRFRKMPKNLASDYIAEIKWKDGHLERKGLDVNEFETVIEDAQYLPQKYIEDVCNDIGNIFQEEIDKVIYSYVDRTERGSAANLAELVKNKSQMIQIEMEGVYKEIERLNECIIRLERKKTSQYRLLIVDSLKKYQEILERHEKNKPQEIKKPDEKEENIQYQEKLKEIDKEITELNQKVEQNRDELTKINEAIGETEQIIAKLRVLRSEFGDIKEELNVYLKKYQLEIKEDFCLKDVKCEKL